MSYYTISDFETVLFSGLQYKLPQTVLDIIEHVSNDLRDNMHLMEEYKNTNHTYSSNASTHGGGTIGSHTQNYRYQNSVGIDKKRPMKKDSYNKARHMNHNTTGGGGNHNSYQKKELTNSDWENLRNYKLTKVEQMEGITKSVSEIRVLINKISEKTYETCKNKILELLDKIMEEYAGEHTNTLKDTDNNTHNDQIYKMAVSIFDIMIANKFNSKLNAELYGLFMDKYGLFNEIIQTYISEFKHTIESIQNADPDKDYDAYCVNVKKNDARKSATTFLMNLFRLGKIDANSILDILDFFLDKTVEYIDMEDKTYVVEEITENVFLMVTSYIDVLGGHEKWKLELYSKIIRISNMKANQHPSLTNRVVFKYMDILDCL
jgi:division protein CdvB (Snf7/Vps24/ESCRT-III family)